MPPTYAHPQKTCERCKTLFHPLLGDVEGICYQCLREDIKAGQYRWQRRICAVCVSDDCDHVRKDSHLKPDDFLRPSELRVLHALGQRRKSCEIAHLCGLTEATTKVYLWRALHVIHLTRWQAAAWARDHAAQIEEILARQRSVLRKERH